MTAADRLPAVIAAMAQVATHGTRGAADTLAPDHDLAAALSCAVDLAEVAPLLPLSGADHQVAAGLLRIVARAAQPAEPLADADRVLACRVAARLASSAALLVALDAHAFAGAAGLLWRAAGRLCGMETAPETAAGFTVPTLAETRQRVAVDLSAHLAAADRRARDAARECVRLHAELDKARKQIADLLAAGKELPAMPDAEVLPRVVEWTDLQPGDLAWDAADDLVVSLYRQGTKRGWVHAAKANRAVLLARNVPKRESAIRAVWVRTREAARLLADEARKPASA